MYTQSILNEKLQSFDYYKNKLPLYLQNSYGFIEHFRIWYDVLTGEQGVVKFADYLLNGLNIFDEDYLNFVGQYSSDGVDVTFDDAPVTAIFFDDEPVTSIWYNGEELSSGYGTENDLLDKIGALLGITRRFSVVVNDESIELNLNNEDFLLFIKARIIKNHYKGSYAEMKLLYEMISLNTLICTVMDKSATAKIYLVETSDVKYSDNVKLLFAAGELILPSMGIAYEWGVATIDEYMKFDAVGYSEVWDNGVWAV